MNPVNNCALSNELDTVDLHYLGIPAVVQRNLAVGALAEQALAQGEGHLANNETVFGGATRVGSRLYH